MNSRRLRRLTIIIVTHNSGDVLDGCLTAVDKSARAADDSIGKQYGLVIVDNASQTRPKVSSAPGRETTMLMLEHNLGFSRGVNRGLATIEDPDLVLLLNPDAQLEEDALTHLVTAMGDPSVAIAGGMLTGEDGRPHGRSERDFHSIWSEAVRQFAPMFADTSPYGRAAARTGEARSLTGACLLIDGTFLAAADGLDEQLAMYLEDVELCWQAHALRRRVKFVRQARCQHILGGSSKCDNFSASDMLYLTLLAARVEFVRRRSGLFGAFCMRAMMGMGAFLRLLMTPMDGPERRGRQIEVIRWAARSGNAPHWPGDAT